MYKQRGLGITNTSFLFLVEVRRVRKHRQVLLLKSRPANSKWAVSDKERHKKDSYLILWERRCFAQARSIGVWPQAARDVGNKSMSSSRIKTNVGWNTRWRRVKSQSTAGLGWST